MTRQSSNIARANIINNKIEKIVKYILEADRDGENWPEELNADSTSTEMYKYTAKALWDEIQRDHAIDVTNPPEIFVSDLWKLCFKVIFTCNFPISLPNHNHFFFFE